MLEEFITEIHSKYKSLNYFLDHVRVEFFAWRFYALQHTRGLVEDTFKKKYKKTAKKKEIDDHLRIIPQLSLYSDRCQSRLRLAQHEILLKATIHKSNKINSLIEEFQILGSQLLSELIDSISCTAVQTVEFTNDFETIPYIYTNGKFYIDTRKKNKTLNRKKITTNPLFDHHLNHVLPMGKKTFSDIILGTEFNMFGLISHRKQCIHLLRISRIGFIEETNIVSRSSYPLHKYSTNTSHQTCEVCRVNNSKRVVYDDKNIHHTQMFYCEDCYRRFYYDFTGSLLSTEHFVFPSL
eukprot:gnl/TRDRNA2_/TRDRNA2_177376_c2_seq4.p1 gnl/TRDRNA2_/TRDRNA2_177376_c2~~gnl/TRDRNA2_/TRDRNA2_177376_c2_seq4.p1  ORF type:complete len:295 (+),score=-22.12 gnl/TRDRNA2_/TRDRNA2_177376_c2_seq4:202-1086(+)